MRCTLRCRQSHLQNQRPMLDGGSLKRNVQSQSNSQINCIISNYMLKAKCLKTLTTTSHTKMLTDTKPAGCGAAHDGRRRTDRHLPVNWFGRHVGRPTARPARLLIRRVFLINTPYLAAFNAASLAQCFLARHCPEQFTHPAITQQPDPVRRDNLPVMSNFVLLRTTLPLTRSLGSSPPLKRRCGGCRSEWSRHDAGLSCRHPSRE
jgi:hypothetical protein